MNPKWSKWSNETKFPFTNLSPGDYRFEVKAKNIYGKESNIASYEFTILPPWYMTIWAYFLFIIVAIGFVWLIVRLNVRRLKKDKERLERIVKERTAEIRMKNAELEQQKEEILAQRDEIEAQRDHVMEQKEQIEVQHNMILEQTKSITDSIHYASRIQEALLPPEEILNEVLPEHFILYKPRDIVSGDFYWASTKNNRTIIVAADCTGHGVPGAFMSMLGISFLNEIINKFERLQANQILNELKESVKKSLRQTGKEHEAKDGMDIALCIIDFEKMEMEFSGAYNSLLLIRDNEMIKYDADRMPVGIYVKDRGSFTNHVIQMKKGDNYYIFQMVTQISLEEQQAQN
ncbi:MAG: SpoIIE family protein phosphatase [Chloroflexia bacterium]|nr:SpoIIE family protein phosphatase [Chloroflexia bacterium]